MITNADAGLNVRQFISKHLRFSAKMIKSLKYCENGICVNGKHVTVRHILQSGECLTLATEDQTSAPIAPVELPIEILYEDTDIVIPSKPADMPTHPSHDHHYDTVANALAYRYAQADIPFVFRPVNRLDRNTSGLLLIARNKPAAGILTRSMQAGEIQKSYLAILDGEMEICEGEINASLHRTAQSIIVREVCSDDAPDADHAQTRYRVLAAQNGHSLVQAYPITGRTHQLRVHFAHLGHPITGDDLYGTISPLIPRHALHAFTLRFPHPASGEKMTVSAPLPNDFFNLTELLFPSFSMDDLQAKEDLSV